MNIDKVDITLPSLLDDFRTALKDEIEVAKRNSSSSAIPLSNGHKVGQQGNAFQYAFLIDSVLNTPDGAPGDLIVPGKSPMAATIVSTEGLRLLISVESDIGSFIPTAKLQTNLAILMRKLIERIEKNATASNPAASRMLGAGNVTGNPAEIESIRDLNNEQMAAVRSALGRNLTVIWGPPGTGKTRTIGTITEYLFKAKRSVLIVSHTNTAVDQAIEHVAKILTDRLQDGVLVRIGEVKDKTLSNDHPDVLLKRQVEYKSQELVEKQNALSLQKQGLSDELSTIQRDICTLEWLATVKPQILSISNHLRELREQELELQTAEESFQELDRKHAELLSLHERASNVLVLQKKLNLKRVEQEGLRAEMSKARMECEKLKAALQNQEFQMEIAKRIEPLRQERIKYSSLQEQKATIETLSSSMVEVGEQLKAAKKKFADADTLLSLIYNTNAMMRLLKRLPKQEEQQTIVTGFSKAIVILEAQAAAANKAYEAATSKLGRILELEGELAKHNHIGEYEIEVEKRKRIKHTLQSINDKIVVFENSFHRITSEIEELAEKEQRLSATLSGDVKDIYQVVCAELQQYKDSQSTIQSLRTQIDQQRKKAHLGIVSHLHQLLEWGTISSIPVLLEEMLDSLTHAYQKLSAQFTEKDLSVLQDKANALRNSIHHLNRELSIIDEKLTQVERGVIMDASILGATLTKAYLSDDIQARKFDTVILDEASMAPIPALWAAALLSENNLIIVGDFKQLPPIVLSSKENTKKWLGRDIFEVSGLSELWKKKCPPDHFVALREQRRMLKEIASVANQFYEGFLVTPPPPFQPRDVDVFTGWYISEAPHDSPVILVDTGSLNAWVTSVVRNGNSSRLNFLSATVAVDLAEQLLRVNRPDRTEGASKRILIVAPYRAHAKLVKVLLSENGHIHEGEVIAGTAHSFQGSEADVVIFDLVVDEPHWRVNLFMPALDEQIKCLLNVGLTRAKFRLFILGDLSYCLEHGKKAFLGKTLLPYLLKSFPRVDASAILPNGLAARAAKAQMTMLGGEIEPDSARVVLTQLDFFRVLSTDFTHAKNRVIIYSPFMTQDRLAFLMPQIQSAIERGVTIFIITKTHSERSVHELPNIRKMESQLAGLGVVVMHKMGMHEKLVFIDDDIIWSGSLNPLSFSNTQEIMERRKSKAVLSDYFQTLRLSELLSIHGNPESKCPICGSEMVAAEGSDEPFYWRCVNDKCFTRGVNQPYPVDGMLLCANCNSGVKFGYWGDEPHWRCVSKDRHRQKIFKSHLKLPKMAALVPKSEIRRLCHIFKIADFNAYAYSPNNTIQNMQLNLFGDNP